MNIFLLDPDLRQSASYMVDVHLNKQVLECFQMLAVALGQHGYKLPKKDGTGNYGYSHESHPLVRWVCGSYHAKELTFQVALNCIAEYLPRLGVDLSSSYPAIDVVNEALDKLAPTKVSTVPTYPFYVPEYIRVKLAGEEYRNVKVHPDLELVCKGYRLYYLLEKRVQLKRFGWSGALPDWFAEGCDKLGVAPFDYVL